MPHPSRPSPNPRPTPAPQQQSHPRAQTPRKTPPKVDANLLMQARASSLVLPTAVTMRKRIPEQSEGLPTKDLCTTTSSSEAVPIRPAKLPASASEGRQSLPRKPQYPPSPPRLAANAKPPCISHTSTSSDSDTAQHSPAS